MTHDDVAGTDSGYHWHLRRGEDACLSCRSAHSLRITMWRDRRCPADAVARVPLVELSRVLEMLDEPGRERAVQLLGPAGARAEALNNPGMI